MSDDMRKKETDEAEAYEAPTVEDLETESGPSVTSAGISVTTS